MIACDPRILSSAWMLIGRQERTAFGGVIDLPALAPDGSLVVIELKRDKTPRDIVAQALDYASWVQSLEAEQIAQIYQRYAPGQNLNDSFKARFNLDLREETLNQEHQIVIVASELDAATERIIEYLNERGIAINAIFFQVFQYDSEQFLSRAWLIDPIDTQSNVASLGIRPSEREPWNGEFYVSFGPTSERSWDDARKYGYVSAGGGSWYSRTLGMLSPGDRIWVTIPGHGYVGVGRVLESMRPIAEFVIPGAAGPIAVMPLLTNGEKYAGNALNDEMAEYFVRVEWFDTVDAAHAVDEVGLFGNQNTVCRPTVSKWRHTVERLKTFFPNWSRP